MTKVLKKVAKAQSSKGTKFRIGKLNYFNYVPLCLSAFVPVLWKTLCLCASVPLCLCACINAQNLIENGNFEKKSSITENLWDGVDNSGRLRVDGSSSPFVADINGDGKKDIVCGNSNWIGSYPSNGMIWYYLNTGTNKVPVFTTGKFIKGRFDSNVKPVVVDWNRDGRRDIVFGSVNGWVQFLRGKGSEIRFEEVKFVEAGKKKLDIGQFSAPAVADWNRDGKQDLILGEGTYSANSVYIYLNEGSFSHPAFDKKGRRYLAYGEGKMHLTPCIVDWDKDGDPDLIVGDEHGYINLYINEAGKGKVKILEYAGRLKRNKRYDIDVGSMSTPCAVDWDEDGDWDIVCGNSQGLISLILNNGSLKEPDFAQPIVLKGKNIFKTRAAPGWSIDKYRYELWMLRNEKGDGAYAITLDGKMPHSGKYCLKIICYEGYGKKGVVHGRIKSPLKRDVEYRLSFFVRGEGFKPSVEVWYQYTHEKAVVGGIRIYKLIEPRWITNRGFNAGRSWKKVSTTFKLPKVKKKDIKKRLEGVKVSKEYLDDLKKKLGEDRNCKLDFIICGAGTMWIDDVKLEEVNKEQY